MLTSEVEKTTMLLSSTVRVNKVFTVRAKVEPLLND
jgi:hypothetical protein